jgi:hypothetical protein
METKPSFWHSLTVKPEEKKPLGRPKHRWKNNTKINLRDMGQTIVDQTPMVQKKNRKLALVNTVKILCVP